MKKHDWYYMKRLASFLSKYKIKYIFIFMLMIVKIVLAVLSPQITQNIVDDAINNQNLNLLVTLSIAMLIIVVLDGGITILVKYLSTKIGKTIATSIRIKCLRHIEKMSGEYYTTKEPGEIFSTLYGDINNIEPITTSILVSFFSETLTALGVLIFLAFTQIDLLILILLIQPLVFLAQSFFQGKVRTFSERMRTSFGRFTSLLDEKLRNLMGCKISGANRFFYSQYIPLEKELIHNSVSLESTHAINSSVMNLLSTILSVGIIAYGGYKVIINQLTFGGIITFSAYAQRLVAPLLSIAGLALQYKQSMVSLKRIIDLLDTEPAIPQEGGYVPTSIKGIIELKDVHFAYNNDVSILLGVSANMKPGNLYAIVGDSGSGKSTIANLLYRLWDVQKGEILIDGLPINKYNLSVLRKSIYIVSQEPFLLNASISDNIMLGRNDITDEQLSAAITFADIDELIKSLPEGLNTYIGENGVRLSGGERQRVSLARAFLQNAQIIIFDESTSALDVESESKVLSAIRKVFSDKTVIIITHRLYALTNSSEIIVLKNGRITETGTHEALMAHQSDYYNLWMKQSDEKENVHEIGCP